VNILLAPDSFKECLSAQDVCAALETGIRRAMPDARIVALPMADGGEGTLDAVLAAVGGERVRITVRGPLAEPVEAEYGLIENRKTAIIESAQAAGLHLVPPTMRRPAETTTFGVGELIKHALFKGVARVIVGLGGSGTNDAGAGMAQALGFSLRDARDHELPFGGLALERLQFIDSHKAFEGLRHADFVAACDVTNPLCGLNGATFVYGPQKGAEPELLERLDAALRNFGEWIEEDWGVPVLDVPGAGAAGGLAAGLIAFTGAELCSGFDILAELYGLTSRISEFDHAITGEGRLDAQSLNGKAPVGVARLARDAQVPCTAVVGACGAGWEAALAYGFVEVLPLDTTGDPAAREPDEARRRLADTAEAWARRLA
jgi:glycerate 2-kinase